MLGLLPLFALNQLFCTAQKIALLLTNENVEIFSCILLLFKSAVHESLAV